MPRYMVHVDGRDFDIELEYRSEKYYARLGDREIEIECFKLGEARAVLLIDGRSIEADVRSNCYDSHGTVFMAGQEIPVEIEDYHLAQLRRTAGMAAGAAVEKIVKAPMPGLILETKATAGTKVAKGQPLVIIEAMKMENIIKASHDGTIKEVFVTARQSVEKNDKLLEFE